METLKHVKNHLTYQASRVSMGVENVKSANRRTMGKFGKFFRILMIGAILFAMSAFPAFASSNASASSVLKNIVNIITSMMRMIGVLLTIWGVAQFVLAVKRTDAESKSDAMMTIVCGIALIAIKAFVNALGFGDISSNDNIFNAF